jgi:hypothetical protein
LGAPYAVYGTVSALGDIKVLQLSLYDTALARTLARQSVEASAVHAFLDEIPYAIYALTKPVRSVFGNPPKLPPKKNLRLALDKLETERLQLITNAFAASTVQEQTMAIGNASGEIHRLQKAYEAIGVETKDYKGKAAVLRKIASLYDGVSANMETVLCPSVMMATSGAAGCHSYQDALKKSAQTYRQSAKRILDEAEALEAVVSSVSDEP